MSTRVARRLAWSLFGLYLLSVMSNLGFIAFGGSPVDNADILLIAGFAGVGALVASREPANAVGWLLLVAAAAAGLQEFADTYAQVGGLPGEVALAWFVNWVWYVWLVAPALILPLIFPTGRLLSPRWRLALAMVLVFLVLAIVTEGFEAGAVDVNSEPVPNPLAVTGPLADVLRGLTVLAAVLVAAGLVLGPLSLVLRLRRSRGRERQQLKVLLYVVVAIALTFLVMGITSVLAPSPAPQWALVIDDFGWLVGILLVILGLPFAVGVAILRHHLYGIDVVIKRTLVYGALTVTLAVSYLGSVLLFRLLLDPLAGQSDLAVAGSTLTVAALFRPLRSRIQSVVDRRFYRERYDATRTLEGFTTHLRDELDLETLGTDLRAVVHDTMQPAHVSLWLRESR